MHIGFQREPGDAFAGDQPRQQFGIRHHEAGQRGGRHRSRHQSLGRLLDHGAQVLDAAAGAAAILWDGNAEQPQFGQAREHRSPRVGVAVLGGFHGAARRRRSLSGSRSASPVAHQLASRELFVGDGRYHLQPFPS
ncbi:hypothetical protein NIIDMKKI_02550 [Mycobacterium kansasii]|uniref:Uncharacterized protein n=1 Tax=Mycobacterium kansasii TaxID=1768 RepID=A0A7G1I688_MYCKA|nr:hypothetical protein NIIDMKKI_02550 [Mycobacterium kansasii]